MSSDVWVQVPPPALLIRRYYCRMSEKKFLSWVGFKNNDSSHIPSETQTPEIRSQLAEPSAQTPRINAPTQSSLERIRELEAQLADLRSRRDITSLTKEEFEILATETAMNLIRTAQSREAKAVTAAQRAIAEATQIAASATAEAEGKARAVLSAAESRSRKYIDAAEGQAKEVLTQAQGTAEAHIESKRREAAAIASAAKREAERMVIDASSDVASFKSWLASAISESERLHRVQVQSLSAAEEAIKQTRARLTSAFERLEALGSAINANLGDDNRPTSKVYLRDGDKTVAQALVEDEEVADGKNASVKKSPAKKSPAKNSPAKKAVAKKAVAKKSPAKKSSARQSSAGSKGKKSARK